MKWRDIWFDVQKRNSKSYRSTIVPGLVIMVMDASVRLAKVAISRRKLSRHQYMYISDMTLKLKPNS